MNNKKIIFIVSAIIIILIVVLVLVFSKDLFSEYKQIKFDMFYDVVGSERHVSENLKKLDGKKVTIKGYMAGQFPNDNTYIYLVSESYVVSPFSMEGDSSKANVMPIYMKDNSNINYTNNYIQVYGVLEIGEKIDELGYTTQFRVIAYEIEELEVVNEEVSIYYNELNDKGLISDIETLQMNIDGLTNSEVMVSWYGEREPNNIIDKIKEDKYFEQTYGMLDENEDGMKGYINYISQCPTVIGSVVPTDERLIKLNEELLDIYNANIELLKTIEKIYADIKSKDMTDEEKSNAYNILISHESENLDLKNKLKDWKNKLRKI